MMFLASLAAFVARDGIYFSLDVAWKVLEKDRSCAELAAS